MKRFSKYLLHAALLAMVCAAYTAHGQQVAAQRPADYPSRSIRLIVPFPPAGATDIFVRILGDKLLEAVGQQIVVDNRAGAAGNIAAEIVARAAPDGYSLLMSTLGNAIYDSLTPKPTYDLRRDFDAVTQLTSSSFMLVVNPSVPATSIKEIVALARIRPNSINYGSSGIGGPSHLSMELFLNATQTSAVHVPYKGSGPAMPALASGEIQMMFTGLSTAQPLMTAGKLRAVAIGRLKRLPAAPEIPTIDESGIKGFEVSTWFGVNAPARTPRPVIAKLHGEIARILRQPDTVTRLESLGFDLIGSTPAEFTAYIRAEIPKWAIAVKKSGARLE